MISIEHDVIPALIPLLSARSSGVQEMAAFALARLAQLTSYQAAIVQVRCCCCFVLLFVLLVDFLRGV